jgi:hypothetical protein
MDDGRQRGCCGCVWSSRPPLAGARENPRCRKGGECLRRHTSPRRPQERRPKAVGREFFDCEPNGVRCPGEASVTKLSVRRFAKSRREELRRGVVIERDHCGLRSGLFAPSPRPRRCGLGVRDRRLRYDGPSSGRRRRAGRRTSPGRTWQRPARRDRPYS